ncbi:hypothetical protein [Thalassovita gelatinovora]|uniref:hypothetical protein n=1 Tax=Thalassovita gelatinovora TaxID=53501 RepID=UPI001113B109|nr:hypothetical protein [Thalassovita gelatinovora]QIZ80555.1 hypothetical protein HFZ77_08695 [Thalassovita gelatinovora]
MRSYLALVLAALLTLTGQSMAVARGMPNAAGEIVLCTGFGPISVLVDQNGQPVGKPHICPDYALSLFALHEGPPLQFLRPLGQVVTLQIETGRVVAMGDIVPATARGPPAIF